MLQRSAADLQWLFFDMGSTLLDETARVQARMEATAHALAYPVEALYAIMERAALQEAHPYALQMEFPGGAAWAPWPQTLDPLYPGVPALLRELRERYRLGVVANHSRHALERLGIAEYFDVVAASAEEQVRKPDPRIFTAALERACCTPQQACMIGDRLDNDIAPAKTLGMRTVWVRQGWGGRAMPGPECQPDFTVDNLDELRCLLRCFN